MSRVDGDKWRVRISFNENDEPSGNRNQSIQREIIRARNPNLSGKSTSEQTYKEMLDFFNDSKAQIASLASEITESVLKFQKTTNEKLENLQDFVVRMHNLQSAPAENRAIERPTKAAAPSSDCRQTRKAASNCFPSMPVLDAETDQEDDLPISSYLEKPPKPFPPTSKSNLIQRAKSLKFRRSTISAASKVSGSSTPSAAPEVSRTPSKSFDAEMKSLDDPKRRQTRSTHGTSNGSSKSDDAAKKLPTVLIKLKRVAEPAKLIESHRDSAPSAAKRIHKLPQESGDKAQSAEEKTKTEYKMHPIAKKAANAVNAKPIKPSNDDNDVFQKFLKLKETLIQQELKASQMNGSTSSSNGSTSPNCSK